MIGFIVVTHNRIGSEMVQAVEEILQGKSPLKSVSVSHGSAPGEVVKKVESALAELQNCHGVVILADLPGATPVNLCRRFLTVKNIEMVTGINLPILIKAASTNFTESPSEVARFLINYGKDNISRFPAENPSVDS